jgi:hypothetical protein
MEPVLIRAIHDNGYLRRVGAAGHEGVPHLARRHDDEMGEADAGPLDAGDRAYRRMRQVHAELGGEELRHALLQVEQHAGAEQPRQGGREDECVR